MITKDKILAKDPNRIGIQILRDHGNAMRTGQENTPGGYQAAEAAEHNCLVVPEFAYFRADSDPRHATSHQSGRAHSDK
jgi:hypothetical protein